jgi:methylated-DNA-[protein]-cysteine S-methyltransferase
LKGRGGAKLDENDFGGDPSTLRRARKEIEEYIEGKRKGFDLRVDLSRLSLFARDVLRAAEKIPYGETRSYSWVARESGHPQAARAVGGALHRNPVPLFMP